MDTVQTGGNVGFAAGGQNIERKTAEFVGGASIIEVVGGVGAVVLAILGLVHVSPAYLLPIAVIAIGGALLAQGSAIAERFTNVRLETTGGRRETFDFGGGVVTEFAGGIAGVVLGILALLRIAPMTLVPIAAIVFGATMLLGSSMVSRLNYVSAGRFGEQFQELAAQAVRAASGTQILTGLGAIVIGILALIGIASQSLSLVAMLALGCSILLSGSAVSGRMFSSLHSQSHAY